MTNIRQFYLSELFISSKISPWLKPKPKIIELAKHIQQEGLLNPLVIRRSGERYEVIDGAKRFKAITFLIRRKLLPRSLHKVPCLLETAGTSQQAKPCYKPLLLSDADFADRVNVMADKGLSAADINAYFACSDEARKDAMSVSTLDARVKRIFEQGNITLRQASAFATLPNPQSQYELLLQLGPFVSTQTIMAAIKIGDTVLNLPDGNILILPSRSKKPKASKVDEDSSGEIIQFAA